jgi:hypothetical protein
MAQEGRDENGKFGKGNSWAFMRKKVGQPKKYISFDNCLLALKCNRCNIPKNYNDFVKSRSSHLGITYLCNECKFASYDKLLKSIKSRVGTAIKLNSKSDKTINLLGCSINEYKKYLESKFDKNMNWGNYGTYWHIDHIIPVSRFDLSDAHQQEQAFNYNNTRPLEAKANISKRDKLTEPQFKILI